MDQLLRSKSADHHILELPVRSATKELMDGYHSWTTQPKRLEGSITSEEEGKIRGQIERDVERDLEEEIRDGIYRLALRLHRLYQHRRERSSWLNISIGLTEGGTKVEIKEMMNEEKGQSRAGSRSSGNNVGSVGGNKFDWTRSLRSSSSRAAGSRKIGGSNCKGVQTAWKF